MGRSPPEKVVMTTQDLPRKYTTRDKLEGLLKRLFPACSLKDFNIRVGDITHTSRLTSSRGYIERPTPLTQTVPTS